MKQKITQNPWLAVTIAQAASITVDGINYTTKNDGTATVAKYSTGNNYSGNIVIPEKIVYEGVEYTIVGTAANAFVDCVDLTSVTLPATCVTIGRNAFKGCSSLIVSPIPATATITFALMISSI